MPTPPPPSLRRRALLGGTAVVAVGVGGCSMPSLRGHGDTPPGSPSASPTASTSASVDPDADAAVVSQVRHQLSVAHDLVNRAGRTDSPLRAQLRDLARLHARHARDLGGLVRVPPARHPTSTDDVRTAVTGAERTLQRQLTSASVACASGALAARIASMAAAVAQRETTL